MRDYMGEIIGLIKGDTRSLDYSSHKFEGLANSGGLVCSKYDYSIFTSNVAKRD